MHTRRLLIPGPVDLDPQTLAILASPAAPHYGDEWVAAYKATTEGLKPIFGTDGDVFVLVGSGSSGLDAAVGSMLGAGKRLALVRNGFFAARFGEIAEAQGLEVLPIDSPWGEAARPEELRVALDRMAHIDALALVHVETSTGVLNPLREIAAIANERGLPVIVDAVTSLGGVELQMDAWGIDICVSASQKALAAPAGLAMVAVGRRGWEYLDRNPVGRRGWYLDLRTWRRYVAEWGSWHPHPATIPSGTLFALRWRVEQTLALGLEAAIARHYAAAARFRGGLAELGLHTYVAEADAAPMVSVIAVEPPHDATEIAARMRDEQGLLIGGGMGPLNGRVVRVGHMGEGLTDDYIDAALAGLAAVCHRSQSAIDA
jgi:alanine-glyoxylate transaminase/serine-glyoxylate transaminase/serine-pyruvate transaminase